MKLPLRTNAFFRIGPSRNDLENDVGSNMAIRFYFVKTEALKANDACDASGKLSEESRAIVDAAIKKSYEFYCTYLENCNLVPGKVTRIHIHFHPEDEFWSFVLGMNQKAVRNIKIADLRYFVGEPIISSGLPLLFVSNYDTHKNLSVWDEPHVNEGPSAILSTAQCFKLLQGETEEEDIDMNSTNESLKELVRGGRGSRGSRTDSKSDNKKTRRTASPRLEDPENEGGGTDNKKTRKTGSPKLEVPASEEGGAG